MANRNLVVMKVFFVLFGVLALRLFYIQVIAAESLSKSAIAQRTTNLDIDRPRGAIMDRNLIPFTGRSVKYSVVLKPTYFTNNRRDLEKVCNVLGIDALKAGSEMNEKHNPVLLEADQEERDRIAELKINGVSIIHSLKRYDNLSVARHVLGYLNRADGMGSSGIEKQYQDVLAYGKESFVSLTIDARSNMVQGMGYRLLKMPADSNRLGVKLTLDYHIQAIVENVMKEKGFSGAVVVEDVNSGDIVAMASMPDFNQSRVDNYLNSPGNELFNRAVASYNLGSIFKIVDAALLMEKGMDAGDEYYCTGSVQVGGKEFRCSSYGKGGHGLINLKEAFARSCNAYFIHFGIQSGYKDLIDAARRFGLGEATGIGEQGIAESKGNLPDAERYYSNGDAANVSIGQGEIMATPLQIANLVATIANGGIRNRANIVDAIVDENGNKVRNIRVNEGNRVVSKETAEKVKQLMKAVTSTGTGVKAALADYGGAAGKTGSAETGRKDVVHAWFAGYFPLKTPKYAIAVFIEGGKSGGETAAPVFAEIAAEIMKNGY